MPHGTEKRRVTEDEALTELPWAQQRRLDAVEHALELTAQMSSGRDRLRVVEMVFLSRRYTIGGAAMQIPCSVHTAKIWCNDFLLLVWGRLKGK